MTTSFPTVLSPWYVVQKLMGPMFSPQFYRVEEDGTPALTNNSHEAMLFMSLQSAVRVAKGVAGEIRVLTTKDELAEFRPESGAQSPSEMFAEWDDQDKGRP